MAKWAEINCPRCAELEAKLRKSALQELSALGQASEAYQAQLAAEAKLAKAVEALESVISCSNDVHIVQDAETTLAELKGQGE
jgi:hypothetical protein